MDFLAVPEIWRGLQESFHCPAQPLDDSLYADPVWESILRRLDVDCRVLSYDQFCAPPASAFGPGSTEWWDVNSRSTPSRMWRWKRSDGTALDIFGRCFKIQRNASGAYEENVPVLGAAQSLGDIGRTAGRNPDWWDWSGLDEAIRQTNVTRPTTSGSALGRVFEVAWQLRGMDTFLMDMAIQPYIPRAMMERLTDIICENIHRVLTREGMRSTWCISMTMSPPDEPSHVRANVGHLILPCHERIIAAIKKHGKQVMYHSDGALRPLIGRLIDMGVDVLNPLQLSAADMEPEGFEEGFRKPPFLPWRHRHRGASPRGTREKVVSEALRLMSVLGKGGGYVLASAHHIQADTPLENVLGLYDPAIRSMS